MKNLKLQPKHFVLMGFVALMLILMAVTFIGSQKSKELRSKAAYGNPTPTSPFIQIPTGSISASPNPCIITPPQTTCTSTINWSTTNAAGVCIVVDSTGLFACGLSGSQQAPWITGNTFVLYANYNMSQSVPQNLSSGMLKELARVTVKGSKATTPTPIPSSISINNPPVISTSFIPNGKINTNYTTTVYGYDIDVSDRLNMTFGGVLAGTYGPCVESIDQISHRKNMQCVISGKPKKIGNIYLLVTLSDNRGGITKKTLTLIVTK